MPITTDRELRQQNRKRTLYEGPGDADRLRLAAMAGALAAAGLFGALYAQLRAFL